MHIILAAQRNVEKVLLLWILALPSISTAYGESEQSNNKAAVREYVVISLKVENWPADTAAQKEITANLQQTALDGPLASGFELVHRYKTVPAVAGWIESEVRDKVTAKAKLANNPILKIDRDISGEVLKFPESSGGGGLFSSVTQIGANKLHELGIVGTDIEVAVLDTGIDRDHPDLVGSFIAEQCFCFNPNGNCCPNGQAVQSGNGSGEDDNGHGTFVAGVLASRGNSGPVGVAPQADLTVLKIVDRNNRFYSTSDIVAALDWLNINRPNLDVVNMSVFTDTTFNGICDQSFSWSQAMFAAVQNLVAKGVSVVAIAGNAGGVGFLPAPGCLSNVVAVGAVDGNDIPAGFSNSHPQVELFAPGVNIVSLNLGGGLAQGSGTSFACPHVAGAAALLKQAANLGQSQIRQALASTGPRISDSNGLTRPRIDTFEAVCSVAPLVCNPVEPEPDIGGAQPGVILLLLDEDQ